MTEVTPKDVVKVLEGVLNYLSVELFAESLSPGVEMSRDEQVTKIEEFIKKLEKMKTFNSGSVNSGPNATTKSRAFSQTSQSSIQSYLSGGSKANINPLTKKFAEKEKLQSEGNKDGDNLPPPPLDMLEDSDVDSTTSNAVKEETIDNYQQDDLYDDVAQLPTPQLTPSPDTTTTSPSEAGTLEDHKKRLKAFENCSPEELKAKAIFSGTLLKQKKSRMFTKWNSRFCILVEDYLFYFKSESEKKEQGVIILSDYTLSVPAKDKGFVFVLDSDDKKRDSYSFQVDSINEAESWLKHLRGVAGIKIKEETELNDDSGGDKTDGSEKHEDVKVQPDQAQFSIDNVYMGKYAFTPDEEDKQDLAFDRGDVMYILDKIDPNWWLGYLKGKVGLVPSNHLIEAFNDVSI